MEYFKTGLDPEKDDTISPARIPPKRDMEIAAAKLVMVSLKIIPAAPASSSQPCSPIKF